MYFSKNKKNANINEENIKKKLQRLLQMASTELDQLQVNNYLNKLLIFKK